MLFQKRTVLYFLAVAMLFIFACDKQSPFSPEEGPVVDFSTMDPESGGLAAVDVMTWNIYVGADVDKIVNAAPNEIPFKVAEAYAELLSTNFDERAETIAQLIKKHRPHLIGLQEISLIQRFEGYPSPTGFIEEFNYLEILKSKLLARGLDYEVAGKVDNADIWLPRFNGTGGFDLVHLVDSDVVLVRGDVGYADVETANYNARLTFLSEEIPRGYVAVSATIGLKTYRFVTTHLESEDINNIRMDQAIELAGVLENETLPIILVGDLNTHAPGSLTSEDGAVYHYLTEQRGYTDIWPHNLIGNAGPGFTAPHDSDLRNPTPNLFKRIDYILTRNQVSQGVDPIGPVQATLLGDELNERTPSGMWPSDHAGIVAKLHIQ